jgi:uncharacterized repeat protein (TIGR01451 family)
VADLNGDSKLDVVVVNQGNNTVSVLLGNGDGTLQAKVDYPVGFSPQDLSLADMNGDGKLDIVVTNQTGNTISILLGNGNGTFQPKVDFVAGPAPFKLVTADVNKDGAPDVLLATSGGSFISILLNTRLALPSANLGITKQTATATATARTLVTYTLTVTNFGPGTAPNAVVTDPIPPGVTPVAAFPSQGTCTVAIALTCNLGALASGASATVTVQARPTIIGSLPNLVRVGALVADATAGNDTSTATVTVVAPQLVALTASILGSGSVSGAGISCPGTCSVNILDGSPVTLTATPAGTTFTGWSGPCAGTGACTFTPDAATTITATFASTTNPLSLTAVRGWRGHAEGRIGHTFHASAIVINPGPAAEGPFAVSFFLSPSSTFTPGPTNFLLGSASASGLASGAQQLIARRFTMPALTPGNYFLVAVLPDGTATVWPRPITIGVGP